jgi:DNA polymerase I-like protein with 3'-5' exonuclease and polymerase domains
VAPAFALDLGPVQHWYFNNREEADKSDWFTIPDSVQYLVAQNATFELCWLMSRHYDKLMAFLKRGGQVLCTQLAEYLLSAQTELYPSLDDIAPRYGGTQKIDAVSLLWQQGHLTSQIDKALLLEYLAGPTGDVVNTRLAIFGQIPKLQEQGMWEMYLMRCESMLYNAFAKFFGQYVDRDQAAASKAEIEAHVKERIEQLSAYLPADLPDREQFNWGSDYHLSALLFGGPIRFKVKVPYDPPQFEKIDAYRDGTGIIYPVSDWPDVNTLRSTLFSMDRTLVEYKSGKNKGLPKMERVDSTTPKLKWGEEVYTFPGLVPFSSLPSDVAEAFTDKRGEFRGKRYLCDREEQWSDDKTKLLAVVREGTPVYSTSGDALELLSTHSDSPLPALLTDLADYLKILGTYFEGLMKNVDDSGILRAPTNNVSTITARLSSKLQQMPRVEEYKDNEGNVQYNVGAAVKAMLKTRFPEGNLVGVDYTALEVVHLAALSGDKQLLDALQRGVDMHVLRLSAKLGRPYEELLAILHDKAHPESASIKQQRQDVKPMAFQYQYGGTAAGISFKIKGVTVQAAQEFIDNENRLFPESSKYRYVVEEAVEKMAEGLPACREQTDDGRWTLFKRAYFVGPSGTRYSFRQYQKSVYVNGRRENIMQFKLPQLANYPVQGEAALVTQVSCGLIIRWLISQDFYNLRVLPVGTVHDANYLDTAKGFGVPIAKHTAALMAYAPIYMADRLPAYSNLREIPYPAVPEIGPNLKDLHHLEEV